MEKHSLTALAREQLRRAEEAANGRASRTVYGGHEHMLRQTLIAMVEGTVLDDHDGPDEGTLYVLSGRVRLTTGQAEWEGRAGDLITVPRDRHALAAMEDAAVLLTVAVAV